MQKKGQIIGYYSLLFQQNTKLYSTRFQKLTKIVKKRVLGD